MEISELGQSFDLDRLLRGLRSPVFGLCFLLGLIGLLIPAKPLPTTGAAILWFLCAPLLEELAWRGILQNELEKWLKSDSLISKGNLIASMLFATAHLLASPKLMSGLTFFPSLCMGVLWSRFHSVWLCTLLHLWYNFALHI